MKPVHKRFVVVIFALGFLAQGCAVGNKYNFSDARADLQVSSTSQSSVAVGALDQRQDILSGTCPPTYVGVQRAGFGNPWRVNTQSGLPQAMPPAPVAQDPSLPPPGFGSLRQDQVGIRLQSANMSVRVLPLDERVTRLLAPDAYQSLREMKASRAPAITQAARAAGFSVTAFIVTFFALQPQVRFTPDLLNISSQNVTYRPIAFIPITPRFSEGVIEQRQQAVAIYLFDPAIPIGRPFTVTYETLVSTAWGDILRTLNTERARVLARAQQPTQAQLAVGRGEGALRAVRLPVPGQVGQAAGAKRMRVRSRPAQQAGRGRNPPKN